jgi:phospholipid/cholesterol/gamma-HCH transport system ATP-binding protein
LVENRNNLRENPSMNPTEKNSTTNLSTKPANPAPSARADGHYLEFQHVSKSFGDHDVLKDVSFSIDQGETAVIMGRSGVGKSVSLKLLLGFLEPDEGRIFVAGQDVTGWNEEKFAEIRRRVTMVFQSGALFDSLTVEENVAFPLVSRGDDDAVDRRVKELLQMLEVEQFAERLPADLSTGTKRSVAIARALAEEPDAILYDEPTTMVDPLMASHISDLILKLKETLHKTAIVVTHDTHLAKKLADRVIFLQEGRVAFFGSWAELEASTDPFLRNFLVQDELIPELDATA